MLPKIEYMHYSLSSLLMTTKNSGQNTQKQLPEDCYRETKWGPLWCGVKTWKRQHIWEWVFHFSPFSPMALPQGLQVQNCSTAVIQAVKTLKETSSFCSGKQEWGLCRAESVGGILERGELEERMSQPCERNYKSPQFTLELPVCEIDPKQHSKSFENWTKI